MAPPKTRPDLPTIPPGVRWPTQKNKPWTAEQIEFLRAYHRAHKIADRPAEYRRRGERNRRYRERVNAYKTERGCSVCGERDPRCLDFHHRDATAKEFNIAVMLGKGTTGWRRIEAEIAKCDVVCANCHRKLHSLPWQDRG